MSCGSNMKYLNCCYRYRIENEWQRLKEDELAAQMFEDEYKLAPLDQQISFVNLRSLHHNL